MAKLNGILKIEGTLQDAVEIKEIEAEIKKIIDRDKELKVNYELVTTKIN